LDVVLFPQLPLPLHIFEERYKEMVNRCLSENRPFGLILATGIDTDTGRVENADVGCEARIVRVERLPDGRMNIEVQGVERFRVRATHEELPYRVGKIEPYRDAVDDPTPPELAVEVDKLLREYFVRSLALRGRQVGEFDLPLDPVHLSFMAGYVLPIPNSQKQALLEMQSLTERLGAVRELLHGEVTRLRRAQEAAQVVWKRLSPTAYDEYRCQN
jgi:Lon protease-like protein